VALKCIEKPADNKIESNSTKAAANMYESYEHLKDLLAGHNSSRESSLDYRIDADHGRVYVRFAGRLTVNLIGRYTEELRKDRAFEPGWSEIVDLRNVEEIEINAEETIALADQIDPFSLSSRRAFVVSNELQRHRARMQQILRSPSKTIGIFNTMEEAEAWVGSPLRAAAAVGAQVLPFPPRSRS
jgi:hypothetical protein